MVMGDPVEINISMWQSLLVYNACPEPLTEGTALVSPFLLKIDTFGKWLRYLTKVCYVKLKKNSDIWTNSDNLSPVEPLLPVSVSLSKWNCPFFAFPKVASINGIPVKTSLQNIHCWVLWSIHKCQVRNLGQEAGWVSGACQVWPWGCFQKAIVQLLKFHHI